MEKTKKQTPVELRDERGAAPCKACKRKKKMSYPVIVDVEGLYFAQCPCCQYYDRHEFLAISSKKAIATWNETMENGKLTAKGAKE